MDIVQYTGELQPDTILYILFFINCMFITIMVLDNCITKIKNN